MKSMKIIKYMRFFAMYLLLAILSVSCEDYLDKAPESDISEKDVFGNFQSFQGYVEVMYNCICDPDKGPGAWWANYSFADENLGGYPYPFDLGNYLSSERYFFGLAPNPTSIQPGDRTVWEWSWYGTRVANMVLEKLEEPGLFKGMEEEKNLLKGQALFFRGWFYFELARYWGGMPYITRTLSASENLMTEEFRRLNFQETARKMAEDFRAAADLLPNHWDETGPGKATTGYNYNRINKFHALGYLGKVLLYAGSPMMNEEAAGSNSFDADLCQLAAEAFGELLKLADQTEIYKLQPWDNWSEIFWAFNWGRTGGSEAIMVPTMYSRERVRWSTLGVTCPSTLGFFNNNNIDVPTHNIIKNFAMANGLPIDDPDSGYNPDDPWTNREPRFYKTILKDGDIIWETMDVDHTAQLYNGGRHRSQTIPQNPTGYYCRKFNAMGPLFSKSKGSALQAYVPYLRLSDIYLMYAEAVLFSRNGGTPQSTSGNYSMTAEQAVNAIRNRAQLPNLATKYTANKNVFFEEIVRERAVELFMEGARFCDLRRWNRNGDPRYLNKTAIDFDRGPDGKPVNLNERIVIKRVAEKKHNWLPIPMSLDKIYEGFPQNPGW